MKRLLLALLVAITIPCAASAQNVGQCGWGSKVFHGQRGIAPQVLAVTTNGTSGNQTFAITTGTSGCTQNGVVTSSWKTAMFIESNKTKLAKEFSVGEGESLESLASLLGMNERNDKELFFEIAKADYSAIYPNASVTSADVADSLRSLLASNSELSKYAANI